MKSFCVDHCWLPALPSTHVELMETIARFESDIKNLRKLELGYRIDPDQGRLADRIRASHVQMQELVELARTKAKAIKATTKIVY